MNSHCKRAAWPIVVGAVFRTHRTDYRQLDLLWQDYARSGDTQQDQGLVPVEFRICVEDSVIPALLKQPWKPWKGNSMLGEGPKRQRWHWRWSQHSRKRVQVLKAACPWGGWAPAIYGDVKCSDTDRTSFILGVNLPHTQALPSNFCQLCSTEVSNYLLVLKTDKHWLLSVVYIQPIGHLTRKF